jgi:hypothetical protein
MKRQLATITVLFFTSINSQASSCLFNPTNCDRPKATKTKEVVNAADAIPETSIKETTSSPSTSKKNDAELERHFNKEAN